MYPVDRFRGARCNPVQTDLNVFAPEVCLCLDSDSVRYPFCWLVRQLSGIVCLADEDAVGAAMSVQFWEAGPPPPHLGD